MIRALAIAVLLAAPLPVLAQTPPKPAAQPARTPSVDPVSEANLSRDGLKAMFDAAKLPATVDRDGNLTVKPGAVLIYVLPGKDRVRLLANFGFAARATYPEKLDLANRINDGYIVVRAAVPGDRPAELAIDHYVPLGNGVSRATLVAVTRRFAAIVEEAVGAVDTERLLK